MNIADIVTNYEIDSEKQEQALLKRNPVYISSHNPQTTHDLGVLRYNQLISDMKSWTISYFKSHGINVVCDDLEVGFGVRIS